MLGSSLRDPWDVASRSSHGEWHGRIAKRLAPRSGLVRVPAPTKLALRWRQPTNLSGGDVRSPPPPAEAAPVEELVRDKSVADAPAFRQRGSDGGARIRSRGSGIGARSGWYCDCTVGTVPSAQKGSRERPSRAFRRSDGRGRGGAGGGRPPRRAAGSG